jgi:hypothetical protein
MKHIDAHKSEYPDDNAGYLRTFVVCITGGFDPVRFFGDFLERRRLRIRKILEKNSKK